MRDNARRPIERAPDRAPGRAALPVRWTVGPGGSFLLTFGWFFAVVAVIGAVGAAVQGMIVVGLLTVGSLAGLSAMCFGTANARQRLGPGVLTVSEEGFSDSRLDGDLVPWQAVERAQVLIMPRTGRLLGVGLWLRPGAARPATSPDYGIAHAPLRTRRSHDLFVDLDGVTDGRDIARAVEALVEHHTPRP